MECELTVQPASDAGKWGRAWTAPFWARLGCLLLLSAAPLLVLYCVNLCLHFEGQLFAGLKGLRLPDPTAFAAFLFISWVLFQALLAAFPDLLHHFFLRYRGGRQRGSVTPSGLQLEYQVNGLQAWLVSLASFTAGGYLFKWFSPTIVYDHWGSLLLAATIGGNLVALFAYLKARYFPSHAADCKFSGSFFYDYFMGIELNPRIWRFDLKLFFNGRPGIVAWTLINLSFAAKQIQLHGTLTNSMLLVNGLHALYVIYFFWNEAWYLKTIDIAHDHFGWMLAWGDCSWLPFMYTLQGLYLVTNPVQLPAWGAAAVLLLGLIGFWIFASANNQKERFRTSEGEIFIWGAPARFIPCTFSAADGTTRHSKLLTSGWWGVARHFNYTGDLIGSLAYCLACGFDSLIPYFYCIYMTILLVHRCYRDEKRCHAKYGEGWIDYCRAVPYRLIPGVF
jgi:7-dehydrocholesterol reductase